MTFSDERSEAWQTRGRRGEAAACGWSRGSAGPSGHGATDVDQVVGDDAQADPTLHAVGSFVAGSVQSMTSFQEADPDLAPGSPPLGMAEPAFPLKRLALGALGTEVALRRAGEALSGDRLHGRGQRYQGRGGDETEGWEGTGEVRMGAMKLTT